MFQYFLIIIIFITMCNVFVTNGQGNKTDDDQINCQLNPNNTLCQFPEDSGVNKARGGVDQTAIKDIVDTHNELRQKVASGQQKGQPSASNMKEMIWNVGLAKVAQRWADQCRFGHDDHRETPEFPDWVGQNVASTSSSNSDDVADFSGGAIDQWFDEVSDVSSSSVSSFSFSGGTGHYTQLVWAETYAIGCGYALCDRNSKYYVCNYGPGGNMGGEPIYITGTPCSKCGKSGCSTNYSALCATTGSTNENDDSVSDDDE